MVELVTGSLIINGSLVTGPLLVGETTEFTSNGMVSSPLLVNGSLVTGALTINAPFVTNGFTINSNNWSQQTYQIETTENSASFIPVSIPNNVTLDLNGLITTNFIEFGSFPIVFDMVANGLTRRATIEAVVNGKPIFAAVSTNNVYTNEVITPVSISSYDPENGPITITTVSAASGLSFTQDLLPTTNLGVDYYTGSITGTLTAEGNHSVTLLATDSNGGTETLVIDFVAIENVSVPQFVSLPETLTNENNLYVYYGEVNDINDLPLTISVIDKPDWLEYSLLTPTTFVLEGYPENTDETVYDVNLSVTNGTYSSNQYFSIEVNRKPRFSNSPILTINENQLYTFIANVFDANGNDVTVNILNKPDWITATIVGNNEHIAFVGNPPIEQVYSYPFSISLTDGLLTNVIEFDLSVVRAPFITSSTTIYANANQSGTYQITTTEPSATFSSSNLPSGVTINSSGLITTNFISGGSFNSTVNMTANGLTRQVVIGFVVNFVPVFFNTANFSVLVGDIVPYVVKVKDPDNEIVQIAKIGGSPLVSFQQDNLPLVENNETFYTGRIIGSFPAAGIYTITVRATDTEGNSSDQQITINVIPPPTPPVFQTLPISEATEGLQYVYNGTVYDGDGDINNITVIDKPAWLNFTTDNISSFQLIGNPPNGTYMVNYPVTLRVYDTTGLFADQSFIINVKRAPVFLSTPIIDAIEETLYTYVGSVEDYNSDAISISATQKPDWLLLTVNGNSFSLSGIPTNEQTTAYDIVITASDGEFTTNQTFTINVFRELQQPPIFLTVGKTVSVVGLIYEYNVLTFDANGDDVTLELTEGPEWLSFTGNSLHGIPPISAQNSFSTVVITATAGGDSVQQTFELATRPKSSGPTIGNDGVGTMMFAPGVYTYERA